MGSETCKPQKGELGGQDGPRRPKTPGPISSHFGSGSCQSVRLSFFGTMERMNKADLASLFFSISELMSYGTLKAKIEKLISCQKEVKKIRRLKIGGTKGLTADTREQKQTLKKELKADITKLRTLLKPAWNRAYRIKKKIETKTKKDHIAMKKINDKKTKDDKPMTRGKPAKYMSSRST